MSEEEIIQRLDALVEKDKDAQAILSVLNENKKLKVERNVLAGVYEAINDAVLDAEDGRSSVSLGCLITNATLRKLKDARAALAKYQGK